MRRVTNRDARRIGQVLTAFETGRLNPDMTPEGDPPGPPVECYLAKATESIPAMSGDTPGSGTVSLYTINDDDDVEDLEIEETAYSIGGDYSVLAREPISGKLVIVGGAADASSAIVQIDDPVNYSATTHTWSARLKTWDGSQWNDGALCEFLSANGEAPTRGRRYLATYVYTNPANSRRVYARDLEPVRLLSGCSLQSTQFTLPAGGGTGFVQWLITGPWSFDTGGYLPAPYSTAINLVPDAYYRYDLNAGFTLVGTPPDPVLGRIYLQPSISGQSWGPWYTYWPLGLNMFNKPGTSNAPFAGGASGTFKSTGSNIGFQVLNATNATISGQISLSLTKLAIADTTLL